MKIAYLSWPALSDSDIPLISELKEMAGIDYYIEVSPRYAKGSVISINSVVNKNGIFKAVSIYPEFAKYKGVLDLEHAYVLNSYGRFWMFWSFVNSIKLKLRIMKNKYDLVHTTNPFNIYQQCLYAFKDKTVMTLHDPLPHSGEKSVVGTYRRNKALKEMKNFIILNAEQKDEFVKYYNLDSEKHVFINRLGCFSYMQDIYKPKIEKDRTKYILFFGRISPYKGVDYLLQAYTQVLNDLKDVELVIAGKGEYHFDISPYQDKDNIRFVNRYIPDDELAELVANCMYCVCPYTDATQSGVIMTAFAFRKTVVATRVGALPDMLGDGKYGILVPPKNIKSLANALVTLATNDDLIRKFELAIEEDYMKGKYSWRQIAERTLEIYKEVLT